MQHREAVAVVQRQRGRGDVGGADPERLDDRRGVGEQALGESRTSLGDPVEPEVESSRARSGCRSCAVAGRTSRRPARGHDDVRVVRRREALETPARRPAARPGRRRARRDRRRSRRRRSVPRAAPAGGRRRTSPPRPRPGRPARRRTSRSRSAPARSGPSAPGVPRRCAEVLDEALPASRAGRTGPGLDSSVTPRSLV